VRNGGGRSRFAGTLVGRGKRKGGIEGSEVRGELLFGLLAGDEADLKLRKKKSFEVLSFNP
jgi:hypothetical protein